MAVRLRIARSIRSQLGSQTSSRKVTNAVSGNDPNPPEIAQVSAVGYELDDVIATTTSSGNHKEPGSLGGVIIWLA
jgi:nickel-dependent lactate racemase